MNLSEIGNFEVINKSSINVYGIEEAQTKNVDEIVPLHLSTNKSDISTIHLLMVDTGKTRNKIYESMNDDLGTIYHFAWIRNLSRLVSSQISKHQKTTWLCDRCLCYFQHEKTCNNHQPDCYNINKCKTLLLEEKEKMLSFVNHRFKEAVPFTVYADLECILKPLSENNNQYTFHTVLRFTSIVLSMMNYVNSKLNVIRIVLSGLSRN